MAWATNWLVVPPEKIATMVQASGNLEDMCQHYLSFHDGDIEGSDFNRLWSIIQGRMDGGRHICDEVFRDGGEGHPKLGRVAAECLLTLAEMSDTRIHETATAWQRTGIMHYGTVDGAASVIRDLQELSQRAISEGQVILLEWWY